MPIHQGLATLSDWSFVSATMIYLMAEILAAAELAFSPARRKDLVTVGDSGSRPVEMTDDPAPPTTHGRTRSERIGRMGVALLVLGAAPHIAAIVLRGVAADRWPLGNMYEYVAFATFIAVAAWLVTLARFPVRRLSVWILLPIVAMMVLDGKVLYTFVAPVQPALQSYWLIIHVTAAGISTGVMVVPGVGSICYLIQSINQRDPRRFARVAEKLPARDVLDRTIYRITIFGFPLFTFAVICGAIWAESAWGRYWGWDPKEATAFIAWVVYATYLHARATPGWRGNRAAIINVLGLAVMIFNLLFVNLVISGLHSYAGLN